MAQQIAPSSQRLGYAGSGGHEAVVAKEQVMVSESLHPTLLQMATTHQENASCQNQTQVAKKTVWKAIHRF